MNGLQILLLALVIHVLLGIYAFSLLRTFIHWGGGKQIFAKFIVILFTIVGPLLIIAAIKAYGKSADGDNNLKHSLDVLDD